MNLGICTNCFEKNTELCCPDCGRILCAECLDKHECPEELLDISDIVKDKFIEAVENVMNFLELPAWIMELRISLDELGSPMHMARLYEEEKARAAEQKDLPLLVT